MKMTKSLKKMLVFSISLVFVVCTFAGILTLNTKNTRAETTYQAKTIDEIEFTMIDGASIRLSEEDETSGIRFGAKISVADYEGL